jgi:MFS family permease
MKKDLNLLGNRYSIIVLMFFPFYTLFNPVATVLARKFGPRRFLGAITLVWGIVVVGVGLVNSWKDQVGLRAVLGILEAEFFPSAVFLVSMWYVRREIAKRIAFFYLLGNICGGFGGILAYGLQQMNGVGGKAGWRWIFIWEGEVFPSRTGILLIRLLGVLTVIIAIVKYFLLVDFPEDAAKSWKFLNPEELQIMIDRVDKDRGDAHVTPFKLGKYLKQAKDWKIWFFAANFGLSAVVTYSVAYFLPIILREDLGFYLVLSQCLSAPVSSLPRLSLFCTRPTTELRRPSAFSIGVRRTLRIVSLVLWRSTASQLKRNNSEQESCVNALI